MSKKVLIAFSKEQLEEIDFIAKAEHRTRSDLLREAVRLYRKHFNKEYASRVGLTALGQPYAQPEGMDTEERA